MYIRSLLTVGRARGELAKHDIDVDLEIDCPQMAFQILGLVGAFYGEIDFDQ